MAEYTPMSDTSTCLREALVERDQHIRTLEAVVKMRGQKVDRA